MCSAESKSEEKPLSEMIPPTEPSETSEEIPASEPILSESQPGSQQSMTLEEALTCAQIIAEEERLEEEEQRAKEERAKPEEEPFVLPPPIQRVSHEAPPSHLANIRAVTESMNIAAIPLNPEPMSFAACVRKMPSVESMSTAPSPYARFDGKSNPFNSGGGGFGSGVGGGGGFNRANQVVREIDLELQ